VAFHWRERSGKKNRSNDNQDYREGVSEREVTSTEFAQQEKNADCSDDGRAHQAANGAPAAGAANSIAHQSFS
jgi:hypothetical protein